MSAIPAELLGLKVEGVRSSRRSAALHILDTALQVRVPLQLADERVAALLQQKRPWLTAKVAELQQLPPQRPKELVSGESFPYLGRHYRLKVQEGHRVGVGLKGGTLIATVRPGEQGEQRQQRIAHYLQQWYRRQALERLGEKAARYSKQIGVSPAAISVRAFKARWGSCTTNGHVAFNWHIIKAPHPVTDYLVIHELCHLIHPNHSKAFWQLVARNDPAYAEHKQWLRESGVVLLSLMMRNIPHEKRVESADSIKHVPVDPTGEPGRSSSDGSSAEWAVKRSDLTSAVSIPTHSGV